MASPSVVNRVTFASASNNATSWTPSSQPTVSVGDFLVMIVSADGFAHLSATGWEKLGECAYGSTVVQAVFYKIADSTSVGFVLTSTQSEQYTAILYVIQDANRIYGTFTADDNSDAYVPGCAIQRGSTDALWIANLTCDSTTVATNPYPYSNQVTRPAASTGGASTSSCYNIIYTDSQGEFNFTNAAEEWVTSLLCVWYSPNAVTPWLSGTSFASETYFGGGSGTWSNPSFAASSSNTNATVTVTTGTATQYLRASGFDFGSVIPAGAEIMGIEIGVETSTDPNLAYFAGYVRSGGSNHMGNIYVASAANSIRAGAPEDVLILGQDDYTFSNSFTYSDVTTSSFAALIRAAGIAASTNVVVDHLKCRIYYKVPAYPTFQTVWFG